MKLLNICNKVIEYSFYLLFFLVPLAFTSDTSELFEFNKLWITFIITVVIGFFWVTKMIIKKEFRLQRTPLDIPIGLFLISEVISTFLSLDMHTSLWGYYSRFNGGLFSILSYVFLYYAFVTNLKDEEVKKEEKQHFEFKKIYLFVVGVVIFFIGALISSQIKSADPAGIPYQMLATLATSLISFAVLMKAAPKGVFRRSLYAILSSALLVVLWGLPSHFGYDPTCLLFRGTFDVACWTNDFQPKIRMFSTLGQPDWLGAYLAVLLPVIAALFINFYTEKKIVISAKLAALKNHNFLIAASFFVFFVLSYISLLYTESRSAIAAFWIVILALIVYYFFFYVKPGFDRTKLSLDFKLAAIIFLTVGAVTFFAGQPFGQLEKFTLIGIESHFAKPTVSKSTTPAPAPQVTVPGTELGGTDSGKIRLYVWEGALAIWKNNPIFGSGLETFAFAYYQYRPVAHNLTSEWNFLYNKAHNEYLNYLATTGTVGIVTYLLMIGAFLFVSAKFLYKNRKKKSREEFLIAAILAGYISILISNFFGFSVVMINILFYIIPAFVFMLAGLINYEKAYTFTFSRKQGYDLNVAGKISVGIASLLTLYLLFTLVNFWNADRDYYFGSNFDIAGNYDKAYAFLKQAVDKRPSEPTFKNELSYNNAVLGASVLAQSLQSKQQNTQQNTQIAQELIQAAMSNTNQVTAEHPNNIVFWKTKVRVLYTLGQIDPSTYFPLALTAIKKSATLAPTDADISYNLGILYGQTGDIGSAISTLKNTIKLKPDYQGGKAYYALAIFYHAAAVDQKGKVINQAYNKLAIDELSLMIKYFGPNQQAQDALAAWQKK